MLKNPFAVLFTFVVLIIAVAAMAPPLFADEWRSDDSDTSLAHFPIKLVDDLPHFLLPDNLFILGTGSVLTAADWVFIDPDNPFASDLKKWNVQPLWDFGNFYGEGWVQGFGSLGFWGGGQLIGDKRLQEFGRDAGESFLLATLTVTGLKYAVGRDRPDHSNHLSFPSGHSTIAFSIAPVVNKYWGTGAGIGAYGLGVITALARIKGYHHYLSDTLAGATLGIIIGNMVVYSPKDVSLGVGFGQAELKLAFN